jgi:uncharacterized protein YkwD
MSGQACWHGPGSARLAAGLALFFGLAASVLSEDKAAAPGDVGAAEAAREADLLRAVNDYRAARGLARWRADPGLAALARAHSRRMAAEGRLTHDGFRERALRSGSPLCVENLVAGARAPEQALAMWRRSPAHHDNLLEPGAFWAGVGVAGAGAHYATLLACATPSLAVTAPESPPMTAPPPSGPLVKP